MNGRRKRKSVILLLSIQSFRLSLSRSSARIIFFSPIVKMQWLHRIQVYCTCNTYSPSARACFLHSPGRMRVQFIYFLFKPFSFPPVFNAIRLFFISPQHRFNRIVQHSNRHAKFHHSMSRYAPINLKMAPTYIRVLYDTRTHTHTHCASDQGFWRSFHSCKTTLTIITLSSVFYTFKSIIKTSISSKDAMDHVPYYFSRLQRNNYSN